MTRWRNAADCADATLPESWGRSGGAADSRRGLGCRQSATAKENARRLVYKVRSFRGVAHNQSVGGAWRESGTIS
ncbi:hypothetical protein [Amycolatopsis lexingtonensis]|uniref:hypothetical protein n=1 Tax=Amycolatopsis lexingtonensis TaxID=218822 RepID=UPI003F730438